MNPKKHVNAISVIFDKEIPEEEKMVVIPKKSCDEKAIKISALFESKIVDPSNEIKYKKQMVVAYKPKIPYPVTLVRDRSQDEMKKFIEISKNLKINFPLCDFLLRVSKYDKYLKEMLTKKKRIDKASTHLG